MVAPSQKAEDRPISFVLHNMADGSPPVEVRLVIRPEDLTRTDTSRLTTTQTLGGAWADNFGPGIPTVQIAGHTGWGAGGRPSGLDEFQRLYTTVFQEWHRQRADALSNGMNPDLVRMIFADKLDDFTWVVAPQNFVLKRNKARPLLAQYQITLTWLSDDVAETVDALSAIVQDVSGIESLSSLEKEGLQSLVHSINKINDQISKGITSFLGPIQAPFDSLVLLTANALTSVQSVVSSSMGVVKAMTNGLLGIATSLTRASANATRMVSSIVSLPQRVQAEFMRLGLAFENAFCVLRNIFRRRRFLPNYDELFGASLCSSTAGGKPISRFDTENPFPVLYPIDTQAVSVSNSASAALSRLAGADVVLSTPQAGSLGADLNAIVSGVQVKAL